MSKRSTAEHPQASATANDAVNSPLNVAKQDQSDVKLKPPACMRFKFLSEKLVITDIYNRGTSETESELERYVAEYRIKTISESASDIWLKRKKDFTHISPFALDMVCAPAWEAYCEHVFSLCGDLTWSVHQHWRHIVSAYSACVAT